ncbi:hypothetical protein EDB81DRAFT_310640 [Dactylonectria macrodidyma]|uniref:Uncharacterized protein n=1 Tax=Dactylonectria macrodidyma TaxID=307937 RepID=A0A9P9D5P3_9HYPO|nr:hypothetical protein EDB81DRAFT_310640 [Dactylonectria macrodidyma]
MVVPNNLPSSQQTSQPGGRGGIYSMSQSQNPSPQAMTTDSHPQRVAPAPVSGLEPPVLLSMPPGGIMHQPGVSSPYEHSSMMQLNPVLQHEGEQPIPLNLDDFPSSSQQAYELTGLEDDPFLSAPPAPEIDEETSSEAKDEEAAQLMPSTPHDPGPESPPSSPNRFFTPTGDYELMALALYRSRRTAALEEMQRHYRSRIAAVTEEAAAQPPKPGKSLPNISQLKSSPPPCPSLHDEGGNHSSPPSQEPAVPDGSQDSRTGDL